MPEILVSKVLGLDIGPELLSGLGNLDHVSSHVFPDQAVRLAFFKDKSMIDNDEPVT
jgi:hypothetical protein